VPALSARQRLVEAMTAVAARHGYAEASVARVVGEAGMSRATFYEHFEDRDDCFLAAFRRAAEPLREELRRAVDPADSPGRPRQVLELLLGAADAHPDTARLLLVEAMAGNAEVCGEHERLLGEVEAALDRYLDAAAESSPALQIPARALLGGIVNLLAMRVFRQEGGLTDLCEDLLAWLDSYALPPGRERLGEGEWRRLGSAWGRQDPTPSPSSSAQVVRPLTRGVAAEHRQRLIEAIARCSREKGYSETTVADVVAAAGIARAAFYEQFRSKEDAYLAAQSFGLEGGAAVAAARFFTEAPWPERIWNAADGLLEYISERPDLSHMQLVESYRVGPAAIRRSFENRMAFTIFLEDGYRQRPEAEAIPRLASEVIAGATEELFRLQIAQGRTAAARELVPPGAYVTVAPYIGPEAALEFVRERCRTAA
jgi:AcrR family transcriptional regulator